MLSQVRFNWVPEKIPGKVPEKVGRHWCRVKSGFNRIPGKILEKVLGGFGAVSGQVQQVSEKCKTWSG